MGIEGFCPPCWRRDGDLLAQAPQHQAQVLEERSLPLSSMPDKRACEDKWELLGSKPLFVAGSPKQKGCREQGNVSSSPQLRSLIATYSQRQ